MKEAILDFYEGYIAGTRIGDVWMRYNRDNRTWTFHWKATADYTADLVVSEMELLRTNSAREYGFQRGEYALFEYRRLNSKFTADARP